MTFVTKRIASWTVCLALVATGILRPSMVFAQAAPATPAVEKPRTLATADQLKSKAFEALRAGKFELTNDYLSQAAAISKDPLMVKMAGWTKQFEEQRQTLAAQRHKEYDKAAHNVQLLQDRHMPAFAIEIAALAYVLSDDKDVFRKEPWVVKLLDDAKATAADFEKNEQWLKSRQIYARLAMIEPEVPVWKERLKTADRRALLLRLYTPDEFKRIVEADVKEREEASVILQPTTRPATKPATQPLADADKENQGKIDWHDMLRDVKIEYLRDMLLRAHNDYFRNVTYRKMLGGGLNSLRVMMTTPALRQAFPGLANAQKRAEFLGMIDANLSRLENNKDRDDAETMIILLRDLRAANTDTVALPEEVLVSEFAEGVVGTLDEYSAVYWPNNMQELEKMLEGRFSGVGIQLFSDESGNLKVETPLEGTPAYRAGIKPGDIITHINGKSARWITTTQAVKLITGQPKTKVTLTIRNHKGEVKDFTLVRDVINIDTVRGFKRHPGGGWEYFVDAEQKIGYVRVLQFNPTTSDDLGRALDQMTAAGAKGVILDLRDNPGGRLNAATDVVQRFISSGVIVSVRPDRADAPNPEDVTRAQAKGNEVKLPLIVLVNQVSASASEIVSGALKDHKRALIVGQRTFGKGSVQTPFPLGDRPFKSYFKVTTAHYYLPNGKCIHREENSKEWGVEPDLAVEMTPEQMLAIIEAQRNTDVLRDGDEPTTEPTAATTNPDGTERMAAKAKKDLLAVDAQLSAALLVLRLQLAGGQPL